MKNLLVACTISVLLVAFTACGQRVTPSDEVGPGPVTETDKQRYNLNPSDEMHHESIQDTLLQDSLMNDSL